MSIEMIRKALQLSPSRHLSDYVLNHYRSRITPDWEWITISIEGVSFQMKVYTGEVHGYLLFMLGILEPELTFFMKSLLAGSKSFWDVGANVGYYSLMAAAMNPRCEIYSFEPAPATFATLKENIETNHFSNIRIHQTALGDENGVLKFNIYPDQALNSPMPRSGDGHPFFEKGPDEVLDVPSIRLDDFVADNHLSPPDVMKLDVEGFEYFVLQGARNVLVSECQPILFCEVQPLWLRRFGLRADDLFAYMERLGYQTFGITRYGLLNRTALDSAPPTEDVIFAPKQRCLEIVEVGQRYYSGWRKAKGEAMKILRPTLKRMRL